MNSVMLTAQTTYAKVAVDIPLPPNANDCFYYLIPEELKNEVRVGTVVHIPFGRQELNGYVLDIVSKIPGDFQIKQIYEVLYKKQIWDEKFLQLAKWVSEYYLTSVGAVLEAAISKEILKTRTKSKKLEDIKNVPWQSSTQKLTLNKEQQNAYETILKSIQTNASETFLLHGVTGSGKTEIYLKLIEEVLKKGKTAIYLVPEISSISQILDRLYKRFSPSQIIIWHSLLTKNQKLTNWEKLQNKNGKIIVGARSAVLAPIQNIGLVVIDEAHDASYKQSSQTPRYDTIKVAQKRGEIEKCPIILGTATPNISDYYHSSRRHTVLVLPNRIENVPMPKVYLVDLTKEYPRTNKNIISNVLKSSIDEALSKKEQVILLLNRRGYSSQIFCRACGYIQECKNCSVPLVFHKNLKLMICHHCGYSKGLGDELTQLCPRCKSPHFKHFGIGTQQLEEEVKKIFNKATTIRVDSDQLKRKDEYINLWREFSSGKADILIGTQIVAKGLDLPNVTIVGVVLADTMLNFPDYVSYEKAFQLLTQVTGRAGRGQKPGKVFIQTYQNENPIFKFVQEHNFDSFYKSEIKEREQFLYPPFTILSRIIFQSFSEKDCINYANEAMEILMAMGDERTTFLGPAPCFFTKLYRKYRYHILCKTNNEETKKAIFNNLFKRLNKNAKVEMIVDIDSINLL